MTEQRPHLYLPPRANKRSHYKEHPKRFLNFEQVPLTPTALFKSFTNSSDLDHTHDFRQCRASPQSNNISKPNLILDKGAQQMHKKSSSVTSSSTTSLHSSIFICIICHTWICITPSAYRHMCTCVDYAAHHYHAKGFWTKSQEYECCGCGNHIEVGFHDAIVPSTILSELSSTRLLVTSPLNETPTPNLSSIITTCQTYIRDLLGNTRRNINCENRRFLESIGLNDVAHRLLSLIGFTYRDGFFLAPGDIIDNSRLCMIHEELGALLARMSSSTKQLLLITEANYPRADAAIMDGLLGRRNIVENASFSIDLKLDNLCAKLGVTSSAADELILWAYQQLTQEQPDDAHDLSELLGNIAAIKDSDLLRTELGIDRIKQGAILSKRKVNRAYQYFGAQKDIDDDTIIAAHRYKRQDFPRSDLIHDEKLRIIGESRNSEVILQYLDSGRTSGDRQGYQIRRSRNSPVGLTNIGNTCYLNSLLQYYYTLIPFRDTIISMNDHVENEDSTDWQGKKVGGILVDQKEVKRAKKFMALLQNIFIQLQHTSDYAITPELELAKMALFNEQEVNSLNDTGSDTGDTTVENLAKEGSAYSRNEKKIGLDSNSSSSDTAIAQKSTLYPDSNTFNRSNQSPEISRTNLLNISSEPVNETDQQPSRIDPATANPTKAINTMMLGKQQDVTECMDNMVYLVEAALKSQHTGRATHAKNIVRDLFYGKAQQILSYKDDNTTKDVQKVMEEDFSHVIVDAAKGKTLYDGLDEHYFAEKVENYQGGHEATREVTVQHFPPVLQIHIQRAQFDRSTCEVYKSNAFIQFDKTIYLDRYIAKNFQALAARREKVTEWKYQLAQHQKNIENTFVKVESSTSTLVDLPATWVLEKAASILDELPGVDPTQLDNAVDQLKEEALVAKNTLNENTKQASLFETKIKDEYTDLTGCAYQLHAVFMHSGEANYGHYWLYILDHKADCWWKFNDSLVTKVKETEVFKDTSGTQSNAYFLVYIKSNLRDSLAAVSKSSD